MKKKKKERNRERVDVKRNAFRVSEGHLITINSFSYHWHLHHRFPNRSTMKLTHLTSQFPGFLTTSGFSGKYCNSRHSPFDFTVSDFLPPQLLRKILLNEGKIVWLDFFHINPNFALAVQIILVKHLEPLEVLIVFLIHQVFVCS